MRPSSQVIFKEDLIIYHSEKCFIFAFQLEKTIAFIIFPFNINLYI